MTEILPYLYLGGVESLKIETQPPFKLIISLCLPSELDLDELPTQSGDYIHIHVKVADENTSRMDLRRLSEEISKVRKRHDNVLVHCIAGASRSATVVLAHLMLEERLTLLQAYTLTKTKRWCIEPNYGFLQQLVDLEVAIFGGISTIDPTRGLPVIDDSRLFVSTTEY